MDFLIIIKDGCDKLTATIGPSVDSLGLHMVISLATIMLVWFGVQEALASSQGGPGFSIGKFLNFFMLITFAYCFVKFYDSAIPGIGYSLKGFVSGGTNSLVNYIGTDQTQEVQDTIHQALAKVGSLSPSFTEPYTLICTYTVQMVLTILTALIGVIVAYGAIAATIIGLLGPLFTSPSRCPHPRRRPITPRNSPRRIKATGRRMAMRKDSGSAHSPKNLDYLEQLRPSSLRGWREAGIRPRRNSLSAIV